MKWVKKKLDDKVIEGVTFCFYKEGKILLEDRGRGFNNEAVIPSGKIEFKDTINKRFSYTVNALYREVAEEFDNKIIITNKIYAGKLFVPQVNVLFHIFIITNWEGEFPNIIKETNKDDSKIEFFDIKEAKSLFKYESKFEMLEIILKALTKYEKY